MRELISLIVLAAGAVSSGGEELVRLPAIEAVADSTGNCLADELPDADSDMPEDEDHEMPHTHWCGPQWAVAASWVYWRREELGSGAMLLNDADGSTRLDAEQLGFDHRWGIDLAAIYNASANSGYELRGLWLDDWTAHARTANPGALSVGTNPATGPFAQSNFETSYRSCFNSLEASARRGLGDTTLLAGLRYAALDEDLLLRGTGGGPEVRSRFAAANDLFGLQLGLVHQRHSAGGAWGVESWAKAGMYFNAIDADASLDLGGTTLGAAADEAEELAWLAEFGLDATYRWRCGVMLRAGYRLLVVDGLAIAAEQIDRATALQLGGPSLALHESGTLVAHGFGAGVEVAW